MGTLVKKQGRVGMSVLAAVMTVWAVPAMAQSAATGTTGLQLAQVANIATYDIPVQPLAEAITDFGRQSKP